MVKETCGVMTEHGPCTMEKGHIENGGAQYHRHRLYNPIEWKMFDYLSGDKRRRVIESGEGVNALTTAISRNRVSGLNLYIEIKC